VQGFFGSSITIDVALVVVVDVVVVDVVVVDVVVVGGGVLFKIELPVACRHFLLSQQPLGHAISLLFRVKSLQNGLRHRKRPLRVLFGTHLHLSSDPFPRLIVSEPCNYDKMILQVNLFQKHSFLNQLTHNMTTDCSLNYEFSIRKLQVQNMSRTCCLQKLF
jgi:hypothetical protein